MARFRLAMTELPRMVNAITETQMGVVVAADD